VEDPTTIAMNLTYFATLGIGLVMFLGVFLAFVITLLLAGLGRLVANAGTALFRGRTLTSAARQRGALARGAKPARREPKLSPEWAAAVERADARATARAKAEAAPEVSVSVREVPGPAAERKAS